ncbi:MAG: 50S ribosome-binding GTPase [Nanoarchaeota archaeon]|nr:50S ribosome-binding GTPase [Nanoarchaeota archaeon]
MVRVKYLFGSRHTRRLENIRKQRGKYPDVMKKVIGISDIILEVMDARFIQETRNLEVEKMIKEEGRKIVYIMNKCDLVDIDKVRRTMPRGLRPVVFVSTVTGKGSRDLRDRIKIEASRFKIGENITKELKEGEKFKGTDIRKKVHIGIIGYPNVGKSSLINLITRRGVAKTSKQAGFTRGMQRIRFTDKILILDTPGVIPESRYSSSSKRAFSEDALLGARTYSHVKDPEDVVYFLMEKNSKKILSHYGFEEMESDEFIETLGKKKNFLIKGGKIDMDRAARIILKDWQLGKI